MRLIVDVPELTWQDKTRQYLCSAAVYIFLRPLGHLISFFGRHLLASKNASSLAVSATAAVARPVLHNPVARQYLQGMQSLAQFDSPLARLVKRVLSETDPHCLHSVVDNLVLNSFVLSFPERERLIAKYGIPLPAWAGISPTDACNLGCPWCYATRTSTVEQLSGDVFRNVLKQCSEMAVNIICITGGEPLCYPNLIRTCSEFTDLYYLLFTNGTLLTKHTCQELQEAGNIAPIISLEGFEAETDSVRGEGVFSTLCSSFRLMRDQGLLFGASVTVTQRNWQEVSSKEFAQFLVDQGCLFCWFPQYMPVGDRANVELMISPQDRAEFRRRLAELWREIPLLFIDMWHSGSAAVLGCTAAGKLYFHVNSRGDLEPCNFLHISDTNILEEPLVSALRSPLFTSIRERIPCGDNLFAPCLLTDHADVLFETLENASYQETRPAASEELHEKLDFLIPYGKQIEAALRPDWNARCKRRMATLEQSDDK